MSSETLLQTICLPQGRVGTIPLSKILATVQQNNTSSSQLSPLSISSLSPGTYIVSNNNIQADDLYLRVGLGPGFNNGGVLNLYATFDTMDRIYH